MKTLPILLGDTDCRAAVNALAELAARLGQPVENLLEAMTEYWLNVPDTVDDQSLAVWAAHLTAKLQTGSGLFEQHLSHVLLTTSAPSRVRTSRVCLTGGTAPADGSSNRFEVFTTTRQIRDIKIAATALPQITGETFTAVLKLDHAAAGHKNEEEAVAFMGRLLKELSARTSRRRGRPKLNQDDRAGIQSDPMLLGSAPAEPKLERATKMGLNRISMLTSADGQYSSTAVLALPDHLIESTRNWLFNEWLPSQLCGSLSQVPPATFEAEVRPLAPGRMKRHWALVRNLWVGVDPGAVIEGDYLFSRLGLRRRELRPPGAISGRRFNMSQSITSSALEAVKQQGMPILSAWDDRAWHALFTGWELAEHEDRLKELSRRAEQLAKVQATYGQGTTKLDLIAFESRLRSVRAGWAWTAHARPHSWEIWW